MQCVGEHRGKRADPSNKRGQGRKKRKNSLEHHLELELRAQGCFIPGPLPAFRDCECVTDDFDLHDGQVGTALKVVQQRLGQHREIILVLASEGDLPGIAAKQQSKLRRLASLGQLGHALGREAGDGPSLALEGGVIVIVAAAVEDENMAAGQLVEPLRPFAYHDGGVFDVLLLVPLAWDQEGLAIFLCPMAWMIVHVYIDRENGAQ